MLRNSLNKAIDKNTEDRKELSLALKNWLDRFYLESDIGVCQSMIADEPPLTRWPEFNAYVAAVVEKLSMEYGIQPPLWVFSRDRFLDRGWYPENAGPRIRKILFAESPAAFRRRGLFVSHDALNRASRFHGTRSNEEDCRT